MDTISLLVSPQHVCSRQGIGTHYGQAEREKQTERQRERADLHISHQTLQSSGIQIPYARSTDALLTFNTSHKLPEATNSRFFQLFQGTV